MRLLAIVDQRDVGGTADHLPPTAGRQRDELGLELLMELFRLRGQPCSVAVNTSSGIEPRAPLARTSAMV